MLYYFAYGSNMSRRRMLARIESAEYVGRAALPGHSLAFHKVSLNDGSGKCDVVPCRGETVLGVLYRFERGHQPVLDRIEGNGMGYRATEIGIGGPGGDRVGALTYVATLVDPRLRPFDWYARHVLEGAREAGLPQEYIARIRGWPTIRDPDPGRAAAELAMYR